MTDRNTDTVGDADERMDSFYREIDEASEYDAEHHDTEVAVSIVEDEDVFSVDLRPAITAGLRYGLVLFDGKAGNNNIVTIHFKPQERIGHSARVDTDPTPRASHIPDGMSERTYYAIIDVADRWDIDMFDAEAFLDDVGFFDGERQEKAETRDRVVATFRHRQPDDPTTLPKGRLPELDPHETTATCHMCGCFGVVPDDSEIVNAALPGTDTDLVCATCASDLEDDRDAE